MGSGEIFLCQRQEPARGGQGTGSKSYSLIAWKKKYYGDETLKRPEPDGMSESQKDCESTRLEKEGRYLTRQREIFKKAAAILTSQEENGWQ